MTRAVVRGVGAAGLVQVLLAYVPMAFLPIPPSAASTAADIAAYYTAHRDMALLVNWLGALGLIPSFVFTAGIVSLMRRAEPAGGWLWLVFLVAVLTAYATLAMVFTLGALLPVDAGTAAKETLKLFADMESIALGFYVVAIAGSYAALAWLIYRIRFLPLWIGGLAAAVSAVGLIGSLGLLFPAAGPYGTISLAGVGFEGLFVLAVSVWFVVRPGSAAAVTGPQQEGA